MVKQIVKEINVDIIDISMFNKIKTEHKSIRTALQADSLGILRLKLNNTTGDTQLACKISEFLHSDPEIIPITEASGVLDVAGTLITAIGSHGRRTASPGTQFVLNDTGNYTEESNAEDLEGTDAEIYYALIKMGASKPKILEKIKSGTSFSAEAAKKIGVIDDINGMNLIFGPVKNSPGRKKINRSESEGSIRNTEMDLNKRSIANNSEPEESESADLIQNKASLKSKTGNAGLPLKGKTVNAGHPSKGKKIIN